MAQCGVPGAPVATAPNSSRHTTENRTKFVWPSKWGKSLEPAKPKNKHNGSVLWGSGTNFTAGHREPIVFSKGPPQSSKPDSVWVHGANRPETLAPTAPEPASAPAIVATPSEPSKPLPGPPYPNHVNTAKANPGPLLTNAARTARTIGHASSSAKEDTTIH